MMAYHISQADPKTEKKFLQTKPTYRPDYTGEDGGIAPPALPPAAHHRPACLPVQPHRLRHRSRRRHRCKVRIGAK